MVDLAYIVVALAGVFILLGALDIFGVFRLSGKPTSAPGWAFLALGLFCGAGAAQLFYFYGLR